MKSRFKFLAVLLSCAVALSVGADQTFPTLQANGTTYKNVTVTTVTATAIYFTYDGGMGNAKLKDLSPDLQQAFHYNIGAATAQEQQQAQANAQYQAVAAGQWGTDLTAALSRARSENKRVLMDFTGSDWCPWCMKLDQDVFSTSQFGNYAQNKLVLVKVDFLRNTPQSDDVKQANDALAKRFGVDGYPTCILLDSSGKELARQVGYSEGGPDAFIAWVESNGASARRFGRDWSWYWLAIIPPALFLLRMAMRSRQSSFDPAVVASQSGAEPPPTVR
jgi:protein disulfide-isomerase